MKCFRYYIMSTDKQKAELKSPAKHKNKTKYFLIGVPQHRPKTKPVNWNWQLQLNKTFSY